MPIIRINQLSKIYQSGVTALQDVSLDIEQGQFYALLGPNGAGKSTLINIIASLVNPSKGDISIAGKNLLTERSHAKMHLGIMPQEMNLGIFNTVYSILLNQAGYYGVPRKLAKKRADQLLSQLQLTDKKYAVIRSLSGGMRRRVMIARALMNDPDILILDEPTAGVDIEIRHQMWAFFQSLNAAGKTIILTTHYLEEAEHLCNKVGILDRGKLIREQSMDALLQELDREFFILYLDSEASILPNIDGIQLKRLDAHTIEACIEKNTSISDCLDQLKQYGITVNRLRNKANRLESLFLQLTSTAE